MQTSTWAPLYELTMEQTRSEAQAPPLPHEGAQ
jgi:hypothetical protein